MEMPFPKGKQIPLLVSSPFDWGEIVLSKDCLWFRRRCFPFSPFNGLSPFGDFEPYLSFSGASRLSIPSGEVLPVKFFLLRKYIVMAISLLMDSQRTVLMGTCWCKSIPFLRDLSRAGLSPGLLCSFQMILPEIKEADDRRAVSRYDFFPFRFLSVLDDTRDDSFWMASSLL